MKRQKKWETFVWIMIWLVILSFIALWIVNIVWVNLDISNDYEDLSAINIIENNTDNIIKKLDLSWLEEWYKFVINKDEVNKRFEILSLSWSEDYRYIDSLWNKQELLNDYRQKTFSRTLEVSKDIVKYVKEPGLIPDMILHFDAFDVDWDWVFNDQPLDWLPQSIWKDKVWTKDAIQTDPNKRPIFKTWWINWNPALFFDWINDIYYIDDDDKINTWSAWYTERTLATVFKTWDDIITWQMIYEEWWPDRWYSFMVYNWDIYAWIWNDQEWYYDPGPPVIDHQHKSVNLWQAFPNTVYYIITVQNSKTLDDTQNTLSIYLNWRLKSSTDHIDKQIAHPDNIWLWWVNQNTVFPYPPFEEKGWGYNWNYFKWYIWEFILWNHALNNEEVMWVQNYLSNKWKINFSEIPKLNIIKKEIKLKPID